MKKRDIIIMLFLIFMDQITKYFAFLKLSAHDAIEIIRNFLYIELVKNNGAAWGMFSGNMIFFYVVTAIALVILLKLYRETKEEQTFLQIALAMIAGGAIGNLIDRVRFRYVRDFISVYIFGYDFPVFNIADSVLVIGVTIIILYMLLNPEVDKDERI